MGDIISLASSPNLSVSETKAKLLYYDFIHKKTLKLAEDRTICLDHEEYLTL